MWLFLKNLLFTVLVPGTVAVYVPLWLVRRAGQAPGPAWSWPQWAALAPLTAGAAVYFWSVWHFAVTGHGTPAPLNSPRRLVVRGLYRHVRNPMYLGVLAVILGWALFFASWTVARYAAGVAVMFHLFVLVIEEPALRRQFGADYRQYCRTVLRWLPAPGAAHEMNGKS